jgi:hypothetical protein
VNRILKREIGYTMAILAILFGLYVGSYYALVNRDGAFSNGMWGELEIRSVPRYRIGGEALSRFFFPIHQIDRKCRTDFWAGPNIVPGPSGEWHFEWKGR